MKLNDLSNLSNLSSVINQLKTVVNTSGRGRFSTETMTVLKNKIADLENQFVEGILEDAPKAEVTAKTVLRRVQESKAELALPVNKEVAKAAKNVQSSSGLTVIDPDSKVEEGALSVTTEAVNDRPDPAISSRLAEEKQKLLAKGKRKAAAK